MSDFGEELSSLMAKKTISAENLCQMAELNPAYLEKLKCGKLLPSNYGVVKKISEVLGLVPEEEYQLWNSYKVSKLGEKHMCTEEALKALFALPAARPQRVLGKINAVSLQNGVPICGRERVYQAIRQLLRESTDSADLLLHVELLRRDVDDYAACHFALMALDEAQYIKNHATKVAKSVKQVTADHRFALTGTPIENRLSELWSIFDFLMPGLLGTYTKFREKYEQPIMAPGPEHSVMADKLQALVGLFIKRRLKKDVLTDLPDKFENVLTVKLEGEQRKLYAAHEQRLRATLTKASDADFNTKKIRILAEFTLLREICCDPRLVYADAKNASAKLDAISELVATCMGEGKKVLVFSQFTSFLELIGARLAEQGVEYYTITGETPKKRRVELVDEFNGNDVPVFLISLKAGNTGLNLVGASVVVHADPWWNAAAQNQATDRAHRIGQTQDVNVYQIVAKDTIEERILKLQEKKNELARQFTDGTASGGVGTLSKDDLLGLLS